MNTTTAGNAAHFDFQGKREKLPAPRLYRQVSTAGLGKPGRANLDEVFWMEVRAKSRKNENEPESILAQRMSLNSLPSMLWHSSSVPASLVHLLHQRWKLLSTGFSWLVPLLKCFSLLRKCSPFQSHFNRIHLLNLTTENDIPFFRALLLLFIHAIHWVLFYCIALCLFEFRLISFH